ncbi:hypothetical protein VTO42DRAFT_5169 [Malbranchea cinnamomea]
MQTCRVQVQEHAHPQSRFLLLEVQSISVWTGERHGCILHNQHHQSPDSMTLRRMGGQRYDNVSFPFNVDRQHAPGEENINLKTQKTRVEFGLRRFFLETHPQKGIGRWRRRRYRCVVVASWQICPWRHYVHTLTRLSLCGHIIIPVRDWCGSCW